MPLPVAGLSAEEDEADSPLATTRVYAERGRGTFSPPDMLRDSMALFLQVLPCHMSKPAMCCLISTACEGVRSLGIMSGA